jgi:phage terminase large subunit-like protein
MGQGIDFIWIDEEPRDQAIYPQCVIRTATGDRGRGGYVVLTFTPENGRTPLVSHFLDDIQPGQYIQNVTWEDAPHLDDEVKEQLLGAIPEYQREMRSKGIPILGSGVIFPVADEAIKIDPIECPDHFHVLNGMDFGWDHPQAHIQLWFDVEEGITYLAHAWRKSERDAGQAWTAVKSWAKDVPCAWPADGLQHEKAGGEVVKNDYSTAGFDMIETHATHVEGGTSVEAGLWLMLQDMREGRFKVFSTVREFFEEKLLYHRDEHGRIVKEQDDVICAVRYAYMMKRYAIPM